MRKPLIAPDLLPALLLALLLALAGPAAAMEQPHRAECQRLTRQISHFEDVAQMASDRGDQMWLNGTLNHIDQLSTRRVRLCPEYADPNYAEIYAKWMAAMIKQAAKAFLTYLTFGAYPGI